MDARIGLSTHQEGSIVVPQSPEERVSDGHCVLVAGAGGGAGASSVAVALAGYLGQQTTRRRVCLVDVDLLSPSVSVLTNTRPAPLPLDGGSFQPELVAGQVLSVPGLGIDVLGPLAWPPAVGLLTGATVAGVLRAVAGSHDVVIIDGGRLSWTTAGVQRAMVDAACQVVLVAEPALGSVSGLAWARELLCGDQGFGVAAGQVGVVWNKLRPDPGLDLAEVARRVGLVVLQHLPDTGDAYVRAVNTGHFPELVRRCPEWAARIHLLTEVLLGPGSVAPMTAQVAEVLPGLHRDGRPRAVTRVRRTLLGRMATTPPPGRVRPAWA